MRSLMWLSDKHLTGWACSKCDWTFPLPLLLSDPDAKKAYDRLASAKFQRHDCATHQPVASLDPDTFIARAKGLVMRGFKPEDAAEIVSREIMFENEPREGDLSGPATAAILVVRHRNCHCLA